MSKIGIRRPSGTALILALWALSLLTVLTVQLGFRVQRHMDFLRRIETRSQLRFISEAGARRAIAMLDEQSPIHKEIDQVLKKHYWLNNSEHFADVQVGLGTFTVGPAENDRIDKEQRRYGLIDEQGKININRTDRHILGRLLQILTTLSREESQSLADAIVDWREYGKNEIVGFFSEEYYEHLEFPYPSKDADFQSLDELCLVRGFSGEVVDALQPYLTVYGDGRVNVNTVSVPVLMALGLNEEVAAKLIAVRKGDDKLEATLDDIYFVHTHNINTQLLEQRDFSDQEMAQIEYLLARGYLTTETQYYSIHSQGVLQGRERAVIDCVYNKSTAKIIYWREAFITVPDDDQSETKNRGRL
jgi:general secretion pathway protein K